VKSLDDLLALTEEELRTEVVIPLLAATPGLKGVSDVHGKNEKGLDVIFTQETPIEDLFYGLQLKQGNISGGGTGRGTVAEIITQLGIARDLDHPVAVAQRGRVRIDRFIVAASGKISETARDEIANRIGNIPVSYWDGTEIHRRIRSFLPELYSAKDAHAIPYLKGVIARYDQLDALDQIPGVARRTLTQVYEEPLLRRKFAPPVSSENEHTTRLAPDNFPALTILDRSKSAVVIAEQDGGKTALFRMLSLTHARKRLQPESTAPDLIPVIVQAKNVLVAEDVIAALQASIRNCDGEPLIDTLTQDLQLGRYAILFDGFSDLRSEEDKVSAVALLATFSAEYPDAHVIVAARPADFLTPRYFPLSQHFTIEEFSTKQVSALLEKWTSDSPSLRNVAKRLVKRVTEALQLPGSPLSATIGVMLYEQERRFITNIAEAVDRYMVIRLGRYAHELGMQQQVEWTRKQDILAEVAYRMIADQTDALHEDEFLSMVDAFYARLGEPTKSSVVLSELLESGVLVVTGGHVNFYRAGFRDFFAGHHINTMADREEFFVSRLFQREWGLCLVFAAGLRRKNTSLLLRLTEVVAQERSKAIGDVSREYLYGGYLLGRILSNSDTSDDPARIAALRENLRSMEIALPDFVTTSKDQFGNIGELAALIAVQHTFFATVGVPWLEPQLEELAMDADLSDEARYWLASALAHLGSSNTLDVLKSVSANTQSTGVLMVLKLLAEGLLADSRTGTEINQGYRNFLTNLKRRLKQPRRNKEMKELVRIRSRALQLETERIRRIKA